MYYINLIENTINHSLGFHIFKSRRNKPKDPIEMKLEEERGVTPVEILMAKINSFEAKINKIFNYETYFNEFIEAGEEFSKNISNYFELNPKIKCKYIKMFFLIVLIN